MLNSKIKTLVLLGMAGAWVLQSQRRRQGRMAKAQESNHTLAPLVDDLPQGKASQPMPAAENPFPKGNPALVPTEAGPGG